MKKIDEKESKDIQEVSSKEMKSKHDKQIKYVVFGIILLFVFVGVFSYVSYSQTHFVYKDSNFDKIQLGKLTFYHTVFPLYHSITGQHVADYNIYLRNDPRVLENIPVPSKIKLHKTIIFSGGEGIICKDNAIAISNMAGVLNNVWGVTLVPNSTISCNEIEDEELSMITLKEGNASKIERINGQCYELTLSNCDILNVTERFIMAAIAQENDADINA
jgi:hypothetical protein